ncbi:hypothetical protein P153DRAFT_17763 [Dothidotthia symphoricarpi CBS 119687]|uniref:Uncharacterized protein n=1 Tax=Dothidotthia symphoricarpi CBS 119687 TaxID=1392245 RepID=A0A6A6ADJ2_9PLEO|nr:uncharacterized protein P153DRAFT_17763 [Dothidotthia symphoricarpi CBS 119687]KAF2129333.1 hypothetical protein P153DRAFT_17763 [Dothidotthia symphoricarpi CBS 119687]
MQQGFVWHTTYLVVNSATFLVVTNSTPASAGLYELSTCSVYHLFDKAHLVSGTCQTSLPVEASGSDSLSCLCVSMAVVLTRSQACHCHTLRLCRLYFWHRVLLAVHYQRITVSLQYDHITQAQHGQVADRGDDSS